MEESGFVVWLTLRMVGIGLIYIFLAWAAGELLVDVVFLARRVVDGVSGRRMRPTDEALRAEPEQALALLIAAPSGDHTLPAALGRLMAETTYQAYQVFVATPASETASDGGLEELAKSHDRLVLVEAPQDAGRVACLNAAYLAAREVTGPEDFAGFVLLDPRGEWHPLALTVLGHFLRSAVMVQLPLFAIPEPRTSLVNSLFVDELVETYGREMVVRSTVSQAIPSAGTGTAFSREAMAFLDTDGDGTVFRVEHPLPSYEAGLRLAGRPGKKLLVDQLARARPTAEAWPFYPGTRRHSPVAVYERLPRSFRDACLQHERRVLGVMQFPAPKTHGPGALFCLLRERARVLLDLLLPAAYAVVVYSIGTALYTKYSTHGAIPPLLETTELHYLALLLLCTLCAWRMLFRAALVSRLYGVARGLRTFLHYPFHHGFKALATFRAGYLRLRRVPAASRPLWDKRPLVSASLPEPPAAAPRSTRRRLGDLLVARGSISQAQLDLALEDQKPSDKPLGEVLVENGVLEEEDLVFALAEQQEVEAVEVDPLATPPEILALVPRSLAERYRVFPIESRDEGVILATDQLGQEQLGDELSMLLGRPVVLQWTSSFDIGFAIKSAYDRAEEARRALTERLGARLVRQGAVTDDALKKALRIQKRTHQRLGEVLVEMGELTEERLEEFLA